MTPFGRKMRALRTARGITLQQMAAELQLSPAYLSALEHGRRSRPSPMLVLQICQYFHLIWEDADEIERLAALSHPRAVVDTAGLTPDHTELANRLARDIRRLDRDTVRQMLALLTARGGRPG
jgi:transcriptional regulator with XRE-family HTH domain